MSLAAGAGAAGDGHRPDARPRAGGVSIAADELGLRPLIDLNPTQQAAQGLRLAAVIPTIVAALHRVSLGLDPLDDDPSLPPAAAYLRAVTGDVPDRRLPHGRSSTT